MPGGGSLIAARTHTERARQAMAAASRFDCALSRRRRKLNLPSNGRAAMATPEACKAAPSRAAFGTGRTSPRASHAQVHRRRPEAVAVCVRHAHTQGIKPSDSAGGAAGRGAGCDRAVSGSVPGRAPVADAAERGGHARQVATPIARRHSA
eukprot:5249537-Prymnesium_polylepis.1